MKILALFISAYKADENLIEIIDNFNNQKLPRGWELKLYIGVDGCKKTYNLLKENKINFYYASKNVGTYVIANSLIDKAKKDNPDIYARFDADDIPSKNYLYHGIKKCQKLKFARAHYRWNNHPTISGKEKHLAWGIIFFDKEVLTKVGGYSEYRVSGDHDLATRLKNQGYDGEFQNMFCLKLFKSPSFTRVYDSFSLSANKNSGHDSSYRSSVNQQLKKDRKHGNKIIPKVVHLEMIEAN